MESRINRNDEIADDLSNYESELSACEEYRDKLITELAILRKTIVYLKEANDNLANQFLTPLIEKSRRLIKIYDEQKSDLDFDVNSKIMIKENGKDRDFDYFSKGIKEMVCICMRISLIDTIFQDEDQKPFIIFDDPFVNLDDAKLDSAKAFISNLAESYQIIYLTCHDSRKIVGYSH